MWHNMRWGWFRQSWNLTRAIMFLLIWIKGREVSYQQPWYWLLTILLYIPNLTWNVTYSCKNFNILGKREVWKRVVTKITFHNGIYFYNCLYNQVVVTLRWFEYTNLHLHFCKYTKFYFCVFSILILLAEMSLIHSLVETCVSAEWIYRYLYTV